MLQHFYSGKTDTAVSHRGLRNVVHFNAAMSACKRDAWREAAQLFHRLQFAGLLPSIITFNQLISLNRGEGLDSFWQRAFRLLGEANGALDGRVEATTATINAVMSTSARGFWNSASELLEGLSRKVLQADQVSFGTAIAACEGQWLMALFLLHTGMPRHRLYPDVVDFTAAIRACGTCKQWHWAMELLTAMESHAAPNEITFGVAISACERTSHWSTAVHLLQMLSDRSLPLNHIICSTAISACEKASSMAGMNLQTLFRVAC